MCRVFSSQCCVLRVKILHFSDKKTATYKLCDCTKYVRTNCINIPVSYSDVKIPYYNIQSFDLKTVKFRAKRTLECHTAFIGLLSAVNSLCSSYCHGQ